MPKARIRGIYATALTKLLLDNGFEIVDPSTEIKERFGIPDIGAMEDIDIYDRDDKQGVKVVGTISAVDASAKILRENLEDAVIRWIVKARAAPDSEEGTAMLDIELPKPSKRTLDRIRAEVVRTLDGHHYYKACGGKIASAVEMAEKLLKAGRSVREVDGLLRQVVEAELPAEGSIIGVEHAKLDGRVMSLGRATIDELAYGSYLKFQRLFERHGTYDGLGVPKEPGDKAVTEVRMEDWYLKTRYYSRDGRYKGTYINLCTPVELYADRIRYIDLEVDVVLKPQGEAAILDEEDLERAYEEGLISRSLFERVKRVAHELLEEHAGKSSV